jgi:hypothetical protein
VIEGWLTEEKTEKRTLKNTDSLLWENPGIKVRKPQIIKIIFFLIVKVIHVYCTRILNSN